jgi:non-heme chloroperoxidase
MASISERENREIEAANASGTTPVVFIHGLWLLPSSWAKWADFFKEAGYAPLTPDWPDDPETVEEARANPDVLAKKTLRQVADHTTEIINALDKKPAVMGHSTGGLLAQMLAGRGLSAATVAIDPGVFRGVLPLPFSVLKGVGPFLVNPLTRGRAITLTFDPHDRPRLARSRPDGARLCQAVRLSGHCAATSLGGVMVKITDKSNYSRFARRRGLVQRIHPSS